jgi:hypothetical protein
LEKDSSCDFSGLVAGTSGYLKAKFVFSKEWNGFVKVAGFLSKDDKEFPPCVLSNENECYIPTEALKYHEFKIVLYGKKNNITITTRPIIVK